MAKKIGIIGPDGRSFLAALEISKAKSENFPGKYIGCIVGGTSGQRAWADKMDLPIEFIDVPVKQARFFAQALIESFKQGGLDAALIMPESLLFQGLADKVRDAGFGKQIIGFGKQDAFIEADKIACKKLCEKLGIPVAPAWRAVDAKDYGKVRRACLELIHDYGGAVLKYPYSAGGKGARIILNAWEIAEVYGELIGEFRNNYIELLGQNIGWPLLIEARMSGAEISFTILLDARGNYAVLPTAMDYPERFAGPPGINNPITGGMGAISPHPLETPELFEMVRAKIADPLAGWFKEKGGPIRPGVIYPGCFVSFGEDFRPTDIRVCEINIRPGEPEFQPVAKRLRNLGPLLIAMSEGNLDRVLPEVRESQLSISMALVTGPGGPKQQKGYPWSLTKNEELAIDYKYFSKKMGLVPSAMDYDGINFKTDGSRVAYLAANASFGENLPIDMAADRLRNAMLDAFSQGRIRAIPRENPAGNRLDLRPDIGLHYGLAARLKK